MAFRGWPAEAIEFFEGLEADNSKSFWLAHKDGYERSVKHPMDDLVGELAAEFGPGRVFRPYRDVRFSKDKSPYKTNIAAMIGSTGYVSVSAEGLGVGSGMHLMSPDQLDRYRSAVAAEQSGASLASIVATVKDNGYDCMLRSPLRTAPKGYPKDHPRIDLLKGKGITVWQLWPPGPWLGTGKAKERIVAVLRASAPLNAWLVEHVGGSAFDNFRG